MPLATKKSGIIINIEELFPVWNIDNESWNENVYENIIQPTYPQHVCASSFKTVKEIYGLQTEESSAVTEKNGKTKKDKKAEISDMTEFTTDSAGNLLPKMFMDTSSKFKSAPDDEEPMQFKILWPFLRDTIHIESNDLNVSEVIDPIYSIF